MQMNTILPDRNRPRKAVFYGRVSTTRITDRIYMLEKGRIIEENRHADLNPS